MVELRKRPAPPAAPPPAKKKATAAAPKKGKASSAKADAAPKETKPPASNPAKDASGGLPEGAGGLSNTAHINTAEEASATAAKVEAEAPAAPATGGSKAKSTASSPLKVGDTLDLEGFGGEVETHDGRKVTLAALVQESKGGVVLFTYPKASTPGCTTQVCLFRDAYEPLTATGLSIYGLSNDTPKSNTTFATKQKLPYPLLCDPAGTLISAIGLRKPPKGTTRGVFVVKKDGSEVLAAEPGGPAATVEVVKKIVATMGGDAGAEGVKNAKARAENAGDVEMAETAGEVADSAQKID